MAILYVVKRMRTLRKEWTVVIRGYIKKLLVETVAYVFFTDIPFDGQPQSLFF